MASIIQASTETIYCHLCDVGYKNVTLRWILLHLSSFQKVKKVNIAKILLDIPEESRKNGFDDITTGDEPWIIYCYQYESKWMIETDCISEKLFPAVLIKKTMITIFIGIINLGTSFPVKRELLLKN